MLIALCEEYVQASEHYDSDQSKQRVSLSLGIELVATVFYAGACCREPSVRQGALRFLQNSRRRESKWHSEDAAAMLSWLISEEEAVGSPKTTSRGRIRLKKLRYFHAINDSLEPTDPAMSFQAPDWVQVHYSYNSTTAVIHEHWIRLTPGRHTTDIVGTKPNTPLSLAYEVHEPFMPCTAAMIVLAHRKGLQDDQQAPDDSFSCDGSASSPQSCGSLASSRRCSYEESGSQKYGSAAMVGDCSIRNLGHEVLAM